ncbi:MAG: phosphoenolpyruvate--protein phosphotransferase [Phycisphaerales bacterium]
MEVLKGIAVSPGIVVGEVFVLENERRRIARRTVPVARVQEEHTRLDAALSASITELAAVRQRTAVELGEEAAKIFAFHLGMLADRALTKPMHDLIEREAVTAEFAAWTGFATLVDRFAAMSDAAFRTKVDDVHDLSARVLRHLIGEHSSRLSALKHRAVVFARDLTPSQAAAFNRSHVLGFVTEAGGRTGHTGIFARALGIPAVVGCAKAADTASDGTTVIVDGDEGLVILDPDEVHLKRYQRRLEQQVLYRLSLNELAQLPTVTLDGTAIELLGNIEFPEEIPGVIASGGVGIGLYRTEFLYLASDFEPTEDDHYHAYSECVRLLEGRSLTIRTLDLGADKYTQDRADDPERNPFLGLRSIRYCLQNLDMFRRQLRAILRAAAIAPGTVKVMFPLITTHDEFRRAKFLLNDVAEDLAEHGIAHDPHVKVGMMVEVPSAAILAEQFAQQVDFFSIGTNDLVQYTLAVDRTNQSVADLFNPHHPAVTFLIDRTIHAARLSKIPVSCCGESAGEAEHALLLLGLGLRSLSATGSSLPGLKRLVRSVSIDHCERVARKAASIDSDVAVTAYLRDATRKIIPEASGGRSAED